MNTSMPECEIKLAIDFIDTYSAAYRKEVFIQNGGFDESFRVPSVEDQEFSFRLARKGYRMVFEPCSGGIPLS